MNTLQKLEKYSRALKKWAEKKRRYDLSVEAGKPDKKPPESEPLPKTFEILESEMEWAEKIRRKITAPKPEVQNLDSQLPKIKMPQRRLEMTQQEKDDAQEIMNRVELGGNDGADIEEMISFEKHMREKYGSSCELFFKELKPKIIKIPVRKTI